MCAGGRVEQPPAGLLFRSMARLITVGREGNFCNYFSPEKRTHHGSPARLVQSGR
jgi:hypothetical protein